MLAGIVGRMEVKLPLSTAPVGGVAGRHATRGNPADALYQTRPATPTMLSTRLALGLMPLQPCAIIPDGHNLSVLESKA